MKEMKVYIAGPITNTKDYREKFAEAEHKLFLKGYKPMNPAILPEGFEHHEYMHICYAMIDVCDAIYMQEGWEDSIGACLEFKYAEKHNKLIIVSL